MNVVEICNLALSRIGDSATVSSIDPPEGSAQAEHCAMFYPLARDTLLESFPWHFALKRARMPLVEYESKQWAFCYGIPDDCLRILNITASDAADDSEYSVMHSREIDARGRQIVWCNTPDAVVRFVARVENPMLWPPSFVDAVAWKLAAMLAGAIIKGDTGAQFAAMCDAKAQTLMAEMKNTDVMQFRTESFIGGYTAPWLGIR